MNVIVGKNFSQIRTLITYYLINVCKQSYHNLNIDIEGKVLMKIYSRFL